MSAARPAVVALWLLATLALCGCERAMHDMYDQPKQTAYQPAPMFADGSSMRTPPDGSVAMAQGASADTSGGRLGRTVSIPAAGQPQPLDDAGRPLAQVRGDGTGLLPDALPPTNPLPVTMPLLKRGHERFDIYCAPCHGAGGDGRGMVAQRGYPAPPSYHTVKLRNATDAHFYRVISNGYGVMYPYRDRVAPADRWAIVAYIRALQLSRHAPVARLDAADLAALQTPAARTDSPASQAQAAGDPAVDPGNANGKRR